MKSILSSFIAVVLLVFSPVAEAAVEMPAASYLKGVTWLGHSSFRIEKAGVVIYIDPWRLKSEPKDGDILLITHPHFDHLDPADIAKSAKPDAVIVTVEEAAVKLREAKTVASIQTVKPGDKITVKGVVIEAVPAYNLNKAHHPKEKQWVGFVVEVEGARIYHAGDTDFIPEMNGMKVDVVFLPVSGTYVMAADEAAQAAKAIGPKVAVPMHYGALIGTAVDAKRFQELCKEMVVEILPQEGGGS